MCLGAPKSSVDVLHVQLECYSLAREFEQFCEEKLIKELRNAFESKETKGPRFVIIKGDPGVGKSSFAAHLATSPSFSPRDPSAARSQFWVVAYHIFTGQNPVTVSPGRLVRNLCLQLRFFPKFAENLLAQPTALQALAEADRFPDQALRQMFMILQKSPAPSKKCCIVLDSLDESFINAEQVSCMLNLSLSALFVTQRTVVDVLQGGVLQVMPPWLWLVATSRREARAINPFRSVTPLEIDAHSVALVPSQA